MLWTWDRNAGKLEAGGKLFTCTNRVRNEIDPSAVRRLHDPAEVRYAIVNGQKGPPYMPRKFPRGMWNIIGIELIADYHSDFWPIKIRTNAHQMVHTWALDVKGGYDHPLPDVVDDGGYHFHWDRWSRSTLGCGRVGIDDDSQIRDLAKVYQQAIANGEKVQVIVG